MQREQFRAAEEQVAIDFPGEAHAAVGLDVFLGAQRIGVARGGGEIYRESETVEGGETAAEAATAASVVAATAEGVPLPQRKPKNK